MIRVLGSSSAAGTIGLALVGLFIVCESRAQEPRIEVGLSYGASDNIGHDGASSRRSDFSSVGLNADLRAERSRLEGVFVTDVRFYQYAAEDALNDDDEVLGSIDGRLLFDVVPDRFTWSLEENFGQIRTNPLEADGPRNREGVMAFSTGPLLNFPVGRRTSLRIGGTVSERRFEDSEEFDSTNTAVNISLVRAIGPASRVGLSVLSSESEFESENDLADQEFDDVFVSYERELSSGGVRASVGRGEVSVGSLSSSNTTMNLAWTRQVATRTRLTLAGGRRLTDMLQLFRIGGGLLGLGPTTRFDSFFGSPGVAAGGGGSGVGLIGIGGVTGDRLSEILLSPNPLERTDVRAVLDVDGRRSAFSISLGRFEDRFEVDDTLDRDGILISFSGRYQVNRRWETAVQLYGLRQEFSVFRDSNEFFGRLRADRTLGNRATLGLAFDRDTRSGTAGAFDENRYTVHLDFRLR